MFERYRTHINTALRGALSSNDIAVYTMLKYYMGWVDKNNVPINATGGKFLRPTLCLFACEATGGDVAKAMPAAAALELIHNFSLIHDDIQDQDRTRHHRETLWCLYGLPKALTAGNVLRVLADTTLHNLQTAGLSSSQALKVIGLLTEAYLEMIEGQYLDISYEARANVSLPQYLDMIKRKTGALIRCALNMGALIGSNNPDIANGFRSIGESVGLIFQVRDDVLGVWGDESLTGKPVGSDILRKKKAYPAVHALSEIQSFDKQTFLRIYEKQEDLTDSDISQILKLMDIANTKHSAEAMCRTHAQVAINHSREVNLGRSFINELDDLIQFLMIREY